LQQVEQADFVVFCGVGDVCVVGHALGDGSRIKSGMTFGGLAVTPDLIRGLGNGVFVNAGAK
jgi:hypothetical protein